MPEPRTSALGTLVGVVAESALTAPVRSEESGSLTMRCLAIVPAFNEAGSVGDVVREIQAELPGFGIIVVDDGSSDATAVEAERAGAVVLRMPFNVGIGGAVQAGYMYARDHGHDVAIQIDGDGQHKAGEVEKLLAPLREGRADMVVGTRWRGEGDNRTSPARRVGTVLFARLVSLIVRQRVTDTTSGFRAVNRAGIRLFATDYPHDYPEVETTALAFRHGLRVLEVPVSMRERSAGASSITLVRSVYYVVKVTLALFVGVFRRRVDIPEDA